MKRTPLQNLHTEALQGKQSYTSNFHFRKQLKIKYMSKFLLHVIHMAFSDIRLGKKKTKTKNTRLKIPTRK